MSLHLKHNEERIAELLKYSFGIIQKNNGTELVNQYRKYIDEVTPVDVIILVDRLVQSNLNIEELKIGVNKILNSFHSSLKKNTVFSPPPGHFLYYLMEENKEMERILFSLKPLIKELNTCNYENQYRQISKQLRDLVDKLCEYNKHYERKENILFPYLEKRWSDYRCLSLMWAYHDDIRNDLNELKRVLSAKYAVLKEVNALTGKLMFLMIAIKNREEQLLYPIAYDTLPWEMWDEMNIEAASIGYAYIEAPKFISKSKGVLFKKNVIPPYLDDNLLENNLIDLGSGKLSLKQLVLILNQLPVDITFINENDEVVYFSEPEERIFPRTQAVLGRTVQNCHPPKSLDAVNNLITAFRNSSKDKESFWIQSKGKFILIQYYAIRDNSGKYRGTLEVTQDITGIKRLDGEKRL